MADETCESHSCTKRFYKYSGDPVITSVDVTVAGVTATMNFTSNPQGISAAKAAVEKRKKDGKMLKGCPKEIEGCVCKPPAELPHGADWSAEETVKYKVAVPKFKVLGANPPENPATIHFTVTEQHADITTPCKIEEEELKQR